MKFCNATLLWVFACCTITMCATGCHPPVARMALACNASPPAVYPGDPVTITATAGELDPKKPAAYSWTSTALATLPSTSNTVKVDTTALPAGVYTVQGRVIQGPRPEQSAFCSASFAIKLLEPPAIACYAEPATVEPGKTTTIHAVGMGPQNRMLIYSYTAAEGIVTGSGSAATFSSAGASSGVVEITCTVSDDKGQTASANTTVYVAPLPRSAPTHYSADPTHYSCLASPKAVRPGDPVVLTVDPNLPGDSVTWQTSGVGLLDAGVESSVLDTAKLSTRSVPFQARIEHGGHEVGDCASSFIIDPNATVAPWPNLDVVRIPLQSGQFENAGFAVYTYILYRRKPAADNAQEVTRFKSILAAVAARPSVLDYGQQPLAPDSPNNPHPAHIAPGTQQTPLRKLAPIVVPVDGDGPFTAEWLYQHYKPALAGQLLDNLDCQSTTDRSNCASRLSGDGPYLISTLVRLTGHPRAFLVQDLSHTTPDVGGEWVSDYMAMVTKKKNWTGAYSLQRASLDFAAGLDRAGGVLQDVAPSVKGAIAFFSFSSH